MRVCTVWVTEILHVVLPQPGKREHGCLFTGLGVSHSPDPVVSCLLSLIPNESSQFSEVITASLEKGMWDPCHSAPVSPTSANWRKGEDRQLSLPVA